MAKILAELDSKHRKSDELFNSKVSRFMPANKMLSLFLSTAVNPLYLSSNRYSKTVRHFFSLYRSSIYRNGSDFHAYPKHFNHCTIDGNSAIEKMVVGLKNGMSSGRKRRRSDKVAKESLLYSEPKWKKRKEAAAEVTPANLEYYRKVFSEQGKYGQSFVGPAISYIMNNLPAMISILNQISSLEKNASCSNGVRHEATKKLVCETRNLLNKANKKLADNAIGVVS